MNIDPFALGFFVIAVLFVGAAIFSARRFARKQEREGRWDKNGPINPTPPSAGWGLVPGYEPPRPQIETEFEGDEPPDDNPPDETHRP